MTANDSKSYLNYLNKLADEYNNTYHRAVGKKLIDADYSVLCKAIETNREAPKLKLVIESELLSVRIFLAKVAPKIDLEKHLLLILC